MAESWVSPGGIIPVSSNLLLFFVPKLTQNLTKILADRKKGFFKFLEGDVVPSTAALDQKNTDVCLCEGREQRSCLVWSFFSAGMQMWIF